MRASFPLGISAAQFADSVMAVNARLRPPRYLAFAATLAVISLYAGFGGLLAMSYGHATVRGKWVLAATLVAMAATVVIGILTRRGMRSVLLRGRHMTSPGQALLVEDEGVRVVGPSRDLYHRWSDIARVDVDTRFVYLMLDDLTFFPLPNEAFESIEERDEFVRHVRAKLPGAPGPVVATHVAPAARPKATKGNARELANDAIRLVLFIPVPEARMAHGWGTALTLAFLTILIPALPSLLSNGVDAEWSWYSLPGALIHVSLVLAAAICAGYAAGRRDSVRAIFIAGLLASVAIDLIATVLSTLASGIPNVERLAAAWHWLPGAWVALALATFTSRLIPRGERRLGIVVASILLVAFPLANVYRDRSLWHAPYNEDAAQSRASQGPAGEEAFYRQPELLRRELEAVQPGRKGVVDVYFIGMAGYGAQDVFMREIDSVAKMFRERFRAEGRVVRLVNNPKTVLEIPIASKTSLAAALKRVAGVMDKDEDVLVLFMTSHGSEDHRFSLTLWPLRFHELDPAAVRSLLDEAGIRYRVVVVSACYSGGFVKPLESPETLVITASAADRNSFGCSNEAQWTYFGKAYFDDALRKTHSFVKAFEIARPAIAAREASEKFDASQPQMSLGPGISAKLEELEAQLDRAAR